MIILYSFFIYIINFLINIDFFIFYKLKKFIILKKKVQGGMRLEIPHTNGFLFV